MRHWIRLSLLCRCKWARNQISGMEMFQSNIYYYVRMKKYIVSTQEFCLHKILVHAQDSCACTTLLCTHNTLVHAQHSCACTGRARDRGRDANKNAAGPARGGAFLLGPGLGPWPLQCMHKSVVHAQECCACTRILCMHKNRVHAQYTFLFLHNNKYCSETFFPRYLTFSFTYTYTID